MIKHNAINDVVVRSKIRQKKITLAGNSSIKIYGVLSCKSGKRLKKENRIFFENEKEAIANGYRPCGHCMKCKYKNWKDEFVLKLSQPRN